MPESLALSSTHLVIGSLLWGQLAVDQMACIRWLVKERTRGDRANAIKTTTRHRTIGTAVTGSIGTDGAIYQTANL